MGGQEAWLDGAGRGPAPRGWPSDGPSSPSGVRTRASVTRGVLVVPVGARPDEGALRPVLGDAVHTAPSIVAPREGPRRPRGVRRAAQDQARQVGATTVALLGLGARTIGATTDEARATRVHVATGASATQDTACDGKPSGVTSAASARAATLDHEAQTHPRAASIGEVGGASRGHEASLGRLLFLNVHYFDLEL